MIIVHDRNIVTICTYGNYFSRKKKLIWYLVWHNSSIRFDRLHKGKLLLFDGIFFIINQICVIRELFDLNSRRFNRLTLTERKWNTFRICIESALLFSSMQQNSVTKTIFFVVRMNESIRQYSNMHFWYLVYWKKNTNGSHIQCERCRIDTNKC